MSSVTGNAGGTAGGTTVFDVRPGAFTSKTTNPTRAATDVGNDAFSGTLATANGGRTDGPFVTFDRARRAGAHRSVAT